MIRFRFEKMLFIYIDKNVCIKYHTSFLTLTYIKKIFSPIFNNLKISCHLLLAFTKIVDYFFILPNINYLGKSNEVKYSDSNILY